MGEGAGTRSPGLGPEPPAASASRPPSARPGPCPSPPGPTSWGRQRGGARAGLERVWGGGCEGVNLRAGPRGEPAVRMGPWPSREAAEGLREARERQSLPRPPVASLPAANHQDLGVHRFPRGTKGCFRSLIDPVAGVGVEWDGVGVSEIAGFLAFRFK